MGKLLSIHPGFKVYSNGVVLDDWGDTFWTDGETLNGIPVPSVPVFGIDHGIPINRDDVTFMITGRDQSGAEISVATHVSYRSQPLWWPCTRSMWSILGRKNPARGAIC